MKAPDKMHKKQITICICRHGGHATRLARTNVKSKDSTNVQTKMNLKPNAMSGKRRV
jgi:hypothetical protein